jgi:hypothetical protein
MHSATRALSWKANRRYRVGEELMDYDEMVEHVAVTSTRKAARPLTIETFEVA